MSKNIIVTGTNRGIGLEICRQLQQAGHKVTAVCRKASDKLKELDIRIVEDIDVGEDRAIESLRNMLESDPIDIVINNAGILERDRLNEMNFTNLERQMQINGFGPLRVVQAVLDKLQSGSKIINITSRMGSIDDNTSGSMYGYRMSKVALNMATVSLAHDLKEKGIAVAVIHPGYVRTDMTGGNGLVDASESAAGIIDRLNELNLENSGSFWHMNGEILPW